ncbi:Gfo/Idh/MocA family protein [Tsukamurella strandjordii]|uniref:Gfo/Idh/MocA family oxidoreductase n=1 Tax=Tsukamurella strandjordii TaxID=147577 RepID=A0AA90NA42_9ACTN|nr:Gfo/Idh/MocA family oxidoreductase [Tsukamurella strandjordii]MDP0398672.1 Gfo/Idh/MocA family oxidoreductase [Tsukamurella strandjordii]
MTRGEAAVRIDGTPLPGGPLRIGVLGAARIAADAIVGPAHALGHRLVAIAARERDRAEAVATEHGVERIHGDYQAVIDDPEVDVIYNPLVNSLHAQWNLAAVRAGKSVLTEKPFAANADSARAVADAATAAGVVVLEGYHYRFHPLVARAEQLLAAGAIGDLRRIDVRMSMPTPPDEDPRWSAALAGGALMDLGCYAAHVMRTFGAFAGGRPTVRGAVAVLRSPGVDSACDVDFGFPGRDGAMPVTGHAHVSMVGDRYDFALVFRGDGGSIAIPDFLGPHRDDRFIVTGADGSETVEHLDRTSTYTHQLAAFADAVRTGAALPIDVEDSVSTMELVDSAYRAAGLTPR